jgi:hypothetical protein
MGCRLATIEWNTGVACMAKATGGLGAGSIGLEFGVYIGPREAFGGVHVRTYILVGRCVLFHQLSR